MAEALSVAGTVAGLVGIADVVVRRVVKYVKDVKHAKEEITSLLQELSSLLGLLHSLEYLAKEYQKEELDTQYQAEHLRACRTTLDKLKDKLERADRSQRSKCLEALQKLRWPFQKEETLGYVGDLGRHKATLALALSSDSLRTLLRAFSDLDKINTELKLIRRRQDSLFIDQERQKILDFLDPANVNPRKYQDDTFRLLQTGTGLWFIESREFKHWFANSGSKLWLDGIAGAGKTVLMSLIIRHTQDNLSEDDALAYFYCDYKNSDTHKPVNILGAIAKQLTIRNDVAFEKAKSLHSQHHLEGQLGSACTAEELRTLILDLAEGFANTLIIVDGLDECVNSQLEVVQFLKGLSNSAEANIKILVASRNEYVIRENLQDEYMRVSIAARSEDLRLYVAAEIQTRMEQGRLRIGQISLKGHIMDRLVEKADGMFRWVTCQIDFLCKLHSDRERREALDKLPPNLPETYERILERANLGGESTQFIVKESLRWITFSIEPLTLSALAEALSVELGSTHLKVEDIIDEAAILDGCGSLIRLSDADNVVELAHFTVKEFLTTIKTRGRFDLLPYDVEEEATGLQLAKVCLTYCCLDNFGHKNTLDGLAEDAESQNHPFRSYAVCCWYDHARQHLADPEVNGLAKKLLQPSKTVNFLSWGMRFIVESGAFAERLEEDPLRCISNTKTLHWASFLLLPEICQWLIEEGLDANRPSEIGRPLHSAICQDWTSRTRWRGLALASDDRDYRLEVVTALHSGGADISATANMTCLSADYFRLDDGNTDEDNGNDQVFNLSEISPLLLSIRNNVPSVFRFLLQVGAVCDARCLEYFRGDSLVLGAVGKKNVRREDRPAFVKLALHTPGLDSSMQDLLQSMAEDLQLETSSTNYNSLLLTAAVCGQNDVVQALLSDFKVDPNYSGEDGMTALHFAAENDHIEVINTLLASGARPECTDNDEETPLHLAAREQDAKCVELLASHVTNLNKFNKNALSPFHLAALNKNLFALKHLVESARSHEVQIVMEGFNDRRPFLLFAAQGGSLEVVDYVLDNMDEIDIFASAENGWNCLHLAAESAEDAAVNRFLKLGLSPNDRTRFGSTPLHLAVTSRDVGTGLNKSLAVVKSLLANGANIDARTNDGTTALHKICWRDLDYDGYKIFDALVGKGAATNLKDTKGVTPLHLLCCHFNAISHNLRSLCLKMVQKLVSHGSEVDVVDSDGESPFSITAEYFTDIVEAHLDNARPDDLTFATQLMESVLEQAKTDSSNIRTTLTKVDVWRRALQIKDNGLITKLVEFMPDVKKRNPNLANYSPMERACLHGCSSLIFDRLNELSGSTDLHERDRGWSLLHLAAAGGHVHMIKNLLAKGYALEDQVVETRTTPLIEAVKRGHVDAVKILIEKGADLKATDNSGWNSTHYACSNGHLDVLSLLIEHGLKTDIRVDVPTSPERLLAASCLHLAALKGHSDILEFLLTRCADSHKVDEVTRENETALFVASCEATVDTVSTLISYGADLEIATSGQTPLHTASMKGRDAIVRVLLRAGADGAKRDSQGYTPEILALEGEHHEVVRILREHEALQVSIRNAKALTILPSIESPPADNKVNQALLHAMKMAIKNGDMTLCQMLLDQGMKIDEKLDPCSTGCTPLLSALEHGKPNMAEFLIDRGAAIGGNTCGLWNTQGYDPVHYAAAYGNCRLLNAMLDHVQDYRSWQPIQPIHLAVASGCLVCINALLDHDDKLRERLEGDRRGPKRSSKNQFSLAPIPENDIFELVDKHKAAVAGDALLTKAIDVPINQADLKWDWRFNAKTFIGPGHHLRSAKPLQIASYLGETRVVSLLLQRGATLNAVDTTGWTALHSASLRGFADIVSVLLRAGANPNAQTLGCVGGATPIHLAADKGHLKTIQVLVERGADMGLRDFDGVTPLHKAAGGGHLDIVDFFMARGGKVQTLTYLDNSVLQHALVSDTEAGDNWVLDHVKAFDQRSVTDGTILNVLCQRNRIAAIEKIFRGPRAAHAKLILDDSSNTVPPVLIEAAAGGHTEILGILLDAGANIETSWRHLGTALMAACTYGRLSAAQILVSRGAQIWYSTSKGTTFDAIAQAKHHPEVIKWLKEMLRDRGWTHSSDSEEVLVIKSDQPSSSISVKPLRRRHSFSAVHDRWRRFKVTNSHGEPPQLSELLSWELEPVADVDVHEPPWARGHRISKFVYRATASEPHDSWMIF